MIKIRLLREVRLMRFEEVYARRLGGKLTVLEVADISGLDERTFRRWHQRYEDRGSKGLVDGLINLWN